MRARCARCACCACCESALPPPAEADVIHGIQKAGCCHRRPGRRLHPSRSLAPMPARPLGSVPACHAAAHALLGYERRDAGICPVVLHPRHGALPALALLAALLLLLVLLLVLLLLLLLVLLLVLLLLLLLLLLLPALSGGRAACCCPGGQLWWEAVWGGGCGGGGGAPSALHPLLRCAEQAPPSHVPLHAGSSAYPATLFTDAPPAELERALAAVSDQPAQLAAWAAAGGGPTADAGGGQAWAAADGGSTVAAPLLSLHGVAVRTPAGALAAAGLSLELLPGQHLLIAGGHARPAAAWRRHGVHCATCPSATSPRPTSRAPPTWERLSAARSSHALPAAAADETCLFLRGAGPNGCGKSTLVKALCGLHPLEGGSVLVAGRAPPVSPGGGTASPGASSDDDDDSAAQGGAGRGQGVMFVPQRPLAAPGGALWQQICYPADGGDRSGGGGGGGGGGGCEGQAAADEELLVLLQRVGLQYLLDRVGDSFQAAADWAAMLSPGELQRLAVARVLHR